jgi:tyrosyl-DNA phosphodiesterase-1
MMDDDENDEDFQAALRLSMQDSISQEQLVEPAPRAPGAAAFLERRTQILTPTPLNLTRPIIHENISKEAHGSSYSSFADEDPTRATSSSPVISPNASQHAHTEHDHTKDAPRKAPRLAESHIAPGFGEATEIDLHQRHNEFTALPSNPTRKIRASTQALPINNPDLITLDADEDMPRQIASSASTTLASSRSDTSDHRSKEMDKDSSTQAPLASTAEFANSLQDLFSASPSAPPVSPPQETTESDENDKSLTEPQWQLAMQKLTEEQLNAFLDGYLSKATILQLISIPSSPSKSSAPATTIASPEASPPKTTAQPSMARNTNPASGADQVQQHRSASGGSVVSSPTSPSSSQQQQHQVAIQRRPTVPFVAASSSQPREVISISSSTSTGSAASIIGNSLDRLIHHAISIPLPARSMVVSPYTAPQRLWYLNRVETMTSLPPPNRKRLATDPMPQYLQLSDLISRDVHRITLTALKVDLIWLLTVIPVMLMKPSVIIHGDEGDIYRGYELPGVGDSRSKLWNFITTQKENSRKNWPTSCPFIAVRAKIEEAGPWGHPGLPHGKIMLLEYAQFLRVVVSTANLSAADFSRKTQGIWFQDFPLKQLVPRECDHQDRMEPELQDKVNRLAKDFQKTLTEYMNKLVPRAVFDTAILDKYDYRNVRISLITVINTRVPLASANKYGHLKIGHILSNEPPPPTIPSNTQFNIFLQSSSLGALSKKYLDEMGQNFCAKLVSATTSTAGSSHGYPLTPFQRLRLVWPSTQFVRQSIDGYEAGGSIFARSANILEKKFLTHMTIPYVPIQPERRRIPPHIKTYWKQYYDAERTLGWVCLTSANTSKAAWGEQQKNNTFDMKNFECGVLFTPFTLSIPSTFGPDPAMGETDGMGGHGHHTSSSATIGSNQHETITIDDDDEIVIATSNTSSHSSSIPHGATSSSSGTRNLIPVSLHSGPVSSFSYSPQTRHVKLTYPIPFDITTPLYPPEAFVKHNANQPWADDVPSTIPDAFGNAYRNP